ncbi:hypothetical protein SETIT_7G245300v2 [Setaria italica]|uniref:BTB domain-containing protein n=1 Tax=Setaria italica TaxID=4555 RepID=A0A368RZC9_SETIT|nr:hypothetical protein SETIT_7G245300v2 [Setaria italica]
MADNNSASGVKPSLQATTTSSGCLTQGIPATHDFEVTNYSLLEGMGIGECVKSTTFSAGGCDWYIVFYPDGDNNTEHEGAFTSVYLCFVGGPVGARVKFKFSLFNKGYRVSTTTGKRKKAKEANLLKTQATTYARVGESWGTDKCDMSIIRSHTEDNSVIQIPESVLHQDLARMLKDREGTDVTFSVGDRFFHAHRYVLAARSKVFKAQLFGTMKEEDARCIKVDNMEPAAFEGLLHYIYTDSLSDDCTVDRIMAPQHLLVAADRYGLDRLRMMCDARLSGWIDVQSVATTLALAEQHQCARLKHDCLMFLRWPDVLRAAMKTEGFNHLIASYPSVASDVLEMAISARIDQ